jgi:hypothetical protein
MTETVSIQVPQALYHRLERLAILTGRPLESLVTQTLASSLPLLPDDLLPQTRDALLAIETLDDHDLWGLVHATLSESQLTQWDELRERRRINTLTTDEQAILDQLTQESELLALRKAYAAVLLKWRGHQIPSLADLEARL